MANIVSQTDVLNHEDVKKVELIRKLIAPSATNEELQLFLYRSKKLGLDPLSGQIHFVKRRRKNVEGRYEEIATIQIGIDGFRLIAERSGQYNGQDPITYVVLRDGKVIESLYYLPDDKPIAAIARVYRKGIEKPFTGVAHYREYVQIDPATGQPTTMWKKWGIMLAKCAEALAFRKAFPDIFSGVYEESELTTDDIEQEQKQVPSVPHTQQIQHEQVPQKEEKQDEVKSQNREKQKENKALPTQLKAIKTLLKRHNVIYPDEVLNSLSFNLASEVIKKLNEGKLDEVRELLSSEEPF